MGWHPRAGAGRGRWAGTERQALGAAWKGACRWRGSASVRVRFRSSCTEAVVCPDPKGEEGFAVGALSEEKPSDVLSWSRRGNWELWALAKPGTPGWGELGSQVWVSARAPRLGRRCRCRDGSPLGGSGEPMQAGTVRRLRWLARVWEEPPRPRTP